MLAQPEHVLSPERGVLSELLVFAWPFSMVSTGSFGYDGLYANFDTDVPNLMIIKTDYENENTRKRSEPSLVPNYHKKITIFLIDRWAY